MDSNQSPTANGPGQFPEPAISSDRDKDQHPRSPDHGPDQGRDVAGSNHEGHREAQVIGGVEESE